jgi:hypothetical protein
MRPGLAIPAAAPVAADVMSDGHLGVTGWGFFAVSLVMIVGAFTLDLIRECHVHKEISLILALPAAPTLPAAPSAVGGRSGHVHDRLCVGGERDLPNAGEHPGQEHGLP